MPLHLSLHRGGRQVSLDDLARVNTPPPTKTHFPIPHIDLAVMVKERFESSGFRVTEEVYAVTADGSHFFGMMEVQKGRAKKGEYSTLLGVRNSHVLDLAAGFLCGSHVFVCDNLAFIGEYKFTRKHTLNLTRDLPYIIDAGIDRIEVLRDAQDERYGQYKEIALEGGVGASIVNDVTIEAMEAGVMPASAIPTVLNEWRNPSRPGFEKQNVWRLFNAFTFCLKDVNTMTIPSRTIALHNVLDEKFGLTGRVTETAG